MRSTLYLQLREPVHASFGLRSLFHKVMILFLQGGFNEKLCEWLELGSSLSNNKVASVSILENSSYVVTCFI